MHYMVAPACGNPAQQQFSAYALCANRNLQPKGTASGRSKHPPAAAAWAGPNGLGLSGLLPKHYDQPISSSSSRPTSQRIAQVGSCFLTASLRQGLHHLAVHVRRPQMYWAKHYAQLQNQSLNHVPKLVGEDAVQ